MAAPSTNRSKEMLNQFMIVPVIVLALATVFGQNNASKKSAARPNTNAPTKVTGEPKKLASGLEYWDIKLGAGDTATVGQKVKVHYTGWLTNGKKFDSSVGSGHPLEFTLGNREVIKGWDEGVAGMK